LRHPHDFDLNQAHLGNRNHYDPNQPRVPKGYHGGGQWTDGKERELSKLQLKFAGPLTRFLSGLRARPRSSPPMPPPPLTVPPALMAPRKPPWSRSPPLQPEVPDRPIPDEPTKPFDAGRCENICEMGNVSEMEKFCRGHTSEGTEESNLCWQAVEILRAGENKRNREGSIAECRNLCQAIKKD
jgi:hypothetical protein